MIRPLPLLALIVATATPLSARERPSALVDPFVGTLADFGQLTPAAVAPFGMVQLGPDTSPANHAGYDYAATTLLGFSHTRGVGVGCGGAGGDLMVTLRYDDRTGPSRLDKASETASAGIYRVRYDDGIAAALTATRGAGIIRLTLPRAGAVTLSIDPRHSYSKRISARWTTRSSDDLRAELVAGSVCDVGAYRLFSDSAITLNGRPLRRSLTIGANDVARLSLTAKRGDVIEVRTGLSSVDTDGALLVRRREVGARPFAAIAASTAAAWDRELGRAMPEGPRNQRALFYTSSFRVMQTPVAIDDPDRRHRENDGSIVQSPKGQTRYASWSLWDNYRTQLPLLALLQPHRGNDLARSLAALYARPKPQWATQTEPFISVRTEHAGIALLDLRRKGFTGFDAAAALAGMMGDTYTLQRDTPDQKIEAAYDNWAVAQLAEELGQDQAVRDHRARAYSYRPMWEAVFADPGEDGDTVKAQGLYQGTIWQYRWAPVFDLDWMVKTVGHDRFVAQLHHFFDSGLFNMTNEPDIQVPWLFAAVGDPQPTAGLVRSILTTPRAHPYTNAGKLAVPFVGPSFQLAPQGFADGMDDDAGAMTAWYVFASLGLYPLVPGQPWYLVTVPAFPSARIDMGRGRRLTIRRDGPADGAFVGAAFNGKPLAGFRVTHAALVGGGELVVTTR